MYEPTTIAARITNYIKGRGLVVNSVLVECGLNKDSITNMKKGSQIGANKVAILADSLNVSVDFLLGRTEVPELIDSVPAPLPDDAQTLLARYQACDDDGKELIRAYALSVMRDMGDTAADGNAAGIFQQRQA